MQLELNDLRKTYLLPAPLQYRRSKEDTNHGNDA